MSQLNFDQIKQAVIALPAAEQNQLREWLQQNQSNGGNGHSLESLPIDVIPPFKTRRVPPLFPDKDMSGEKQWIAENSAQYAGQWVALDGNHLIKAGSSAKEVHDAALELGIALPLLLLVESPDAPPFAGF